MSSQPFLTVPPTDPETHPSLEHVAIWAEDVGRSAAFLEDALGWRLHPMVFGVPDDNPVYGGMDLRFVDGNGLWLELVQPMTEGPGMEFMKEKGNGAIVELDFFVNDFDRNFEQMKARGIDLVGMDGKPMVGGGLLQEYVMVDGKRVLADERLSYLPFELARGTSIELAWEYPNGAVYVRDAQWSAAVATPKDTPRLDHVVVLAEDLDSTAHIYGDILRLPRHSSAKGLRRPWLGVGDEGHAWFVCSASGFWLELVSPGKSAAGQAAIRKFGDGNIMELAAEVQDIEAFCRRMNAKGITMTAGDDQPLPQGQTAVTVEGTGDRFAYFPLDRSEGMRIMVFQRGPAATSVYHLRDKK
jgi:catechol 2,3-dioxygenase-like lactoylglutathione lyase family enzyme